MAGHALPPAVYAAGLASLPRVGPSWLRSVIASHGPRRAWQLAVEGHLAPPSQPPREQRPPTPSLGEAARAVDLEALWNRLERNDIAVTWPDEALYPKVLLERPSPPGVLFMSGDPSVFARQPCVALIGTRRCTPDGAAVAYQMARELAEAGVAVVSGLALGIDGAAHSGALAAAAGLRTGPTIGVSASGVDVVYPRQHAALWRQIVRSGAIISETPPGVAAQAWRFPSRNRVIAALSQMVVVVECHARGGSWHTVDAALRSGVEVGAVPGPVRSSASVGTNTLLYEGAAPVRSADDVLVSLGHPGPGAPASATAGNLCSLAGTGPEQGTGLRSGGRRANVAGGRAAGRAPERPKGACDRAPELQAKALGRLELQVLASLGWRPLCLEEIAERSGLPLGPVILSLENLEQYGVIEGTRGWWARK